MKHAKKIVKFLVKGLALLIIIPALVHGITLFAHSMARETSLYLCYDPFPSFTKKYGNRYVALDMIYFLREVYDGVSCEESTQVLIFRSMYDKYPDMREQYLSALVDGIIDSNTKEINRGMLFDRLHELTSINFENAPINTTFQEMGPYVYTGVAEVEKWWEEHNREKLLKVQEVMKADPYYSGKVLENGSEKE